MSASSHTHAWSDNHTTTTAESAEAGGTLRQWAIGAATALSAIGVWALMVWFGVLLVQALGLLPPSVPA